MLQNSSNTAPVIVLNSWGSFHVYPATIAKAKQLLEEKVEQFKDSPAMRILNNWRAQKDDASETDLPYLVADSLVTRALKELTTFELGAPSRALYRLVTEVPEKEGTVLITKEWRDAYVLWAFESKFNLDNSSASVLNQKTPESVLPFFTGMVARAKGRPIKYVYASDMDDAVELEQLLYGRWKETANVKNVVQRYLTYLDSLSHRDEKYHLGTYTLEA